MKNFDKIINLERPFFDRFPPMPQSSRAVQFGAFRALTGHEEAISEEARLTDSFLEVSREKTVLINRRMNEAKEIISQRPEVTVVHFIPDEYKSGGKYVSYTGNLRLIDDVLHTLTFTDGTKIHFSAIQGFELIKK
jgi:hypothetical protein